MTDFYVMLPAAIDWRSEAMWRPVAAGVLLVASLVLSLPAGVPHGRVRRFLALLTGLSGLALLWWALPRIGSLAVEIDFWVLAVMTLVAAAAAISSRSPVYCAIWFAVTLLGTGALLLLQGAHFLGVATVAIYAGAIVVTFLFVLMLAQPEGHAYYDRVSWGTVPKWIAVVTCVLFALLIVGSATRPDAKVLGDRQAIIDQLRRQWAEVIPDAEPRTLRYENPGNGVVARLMVSVPVAQREAFNEIAPTLSARGLSIIQAQHPEWQVTQLRFDLQDVRARDHTASLGSQLFTRQLIAVQAAGALLLAALVGSLAISSRTGAQQTQAERAR